jgi:hypothetical protein
MRTRCWLVGLLLSLPVFAHVQTAAPLQLVQTIPMPNVKGRIDHMDVDVNGNRLFVAGLENGSLEVVDLRAGKWSKSIPGFKKTQGVAYVRSLNKVFVASGDDGMLRVFRGDTLDLLDASWTSVPTESFLIPTPSFSTSDTAERMPGRTTAKSESSTPRRISKSAISKWTPTPRSFCWMPPVKPYSSSFRP